MALDRIYYSAHDLTRLLYTSRPHHRGSCSALSTPKAAAELTPGAAVLSSFGHRQLLTLFGIPSIQDTSLRSRRIIVSHDSAGI